MAGYKLSRSARTDLREIYGYGFQEYGEIRADRYFAELLVRFEQIAENPFLFPAVDHIREGYRRAVCGVHSIYYRIEKDGVEIMRLLSRQDAAEGLG
jgi:toxin ParE1/3/4